MNIDEAKQSVIDVFNDLSPIVIEVVEKHSKILDKLIDKISKAESLTNNELRTYMLQLSIEAYYFGMSKDASLLKQECATTLMKEAQAKAYNAADGTQVVRTNESIINTIDKQVVNLVYNAVANLMKTKLDEAHRMINTLNSILISRNAEAKLTNYDEVQDKRILNESQE